MSPKDNAATWKRAVTLIAALLCLGLAGALGFVSKGNTFFRSYGKWMLGGFLLLGGI